MKTILRLSLILTLGALHSCKEEVNTPPILMDQSFTVVENSPEGSLVGKVEANDADNNALSFTLVMGNAGMAFALDEASGELSVSNPGELDYERRKEFSLTVKVSDGELEAQAIITVYVEDQDQELGNYNPRTFSRDGNSLPYQILFPYNYSESSSLPLLVFLHGAGERGSDNRAQLKHGSELFRDSIRDYPAIVIFPQCATGEYWSNSFAGPLEPANPSMSLVEALIDSLLTSDKVDPTRVYVGGLSMGGFGTAQLLAKFPDRFAAGVVICGGAPLDHAAQLKMTPTWIFHGTADDVVNPQYSIDYYNAIDDLTSVHRLTLYEGVGHLSWDHAFAEPDFLSWIFSMRKN